PRVRHPPSPCGVRTARHELFAALQDREMAYPPSPNTGPGAELGFCAGLGRGDCALFAPSSGRRQDLFRSSAGSGYRGTDGPRNRATNGEVDGSLPLASNTDARHMRGWGVARQNNWARADLEPAEIC